MVTEATDWSVSFFPEGGELVYGLESRVSIEVMDNLGNPVKTSGFLLDQEGQKLQEIATSDRGIGSFVFKPKIGVSYSTLFNNGVKSFETDLPSPNSEGTVVKLDYKPAEKEYSLKIQSTESQGYSIC